MEDGPDAAPLIETERLLLRLPDPADLEAYALLYGDAEVMRYIGDGRTGTREDAETRIERDRRWWESDGFGHFTVTRREDDEPIGRVGLQCWDPTNWTPGTRADIGDHAEIELGWLLQRRAWGRGFATEAASAVRDWALSHVRPRRLISIIHPGNAASKRVAEKIGEHYEGEIVRLRGDVVELWTT